MQAYRRFHCLLRCHDNAHGHAVAVLGNGQAVVRRQTLCLRCLRKVAHVVIPGLHAKHEAARCCECCRRGLFERLQHVLGYALIIRGAPQHMGRTLYSLTLREAPRMAPPRGSRIMADKR